MSNRRPARRARLLAAVLAIAAACTGHPAPPASRTTTPIPTATPTAKPPGPTLAPCGPNNPDALPVRLTSVVMPTTRVSWAVEASFDGCRNGPWRILRSTDAGRAWREVTPPTPLDPGFDPTFDGPERAWALARVTRRTVVVLRTDDGGARWRRGVPFTLLREPAGTIDFVDARHGWLVQDLGVAAGSEGLQIMRTSDAGRTWKNATITHVARDTPGGLPFGCDKWATFSDPSTAWAAGQCGGYPFFMVTRDGGRTWRHAEKTLPGVAGPLIAGGAPPGAVNGEAGQPVFFSSLRGVVQLHLYDPKTNGDSRSVICVTDDGGRRWRSAPLPRGPMPFGSHFLDRDHWWLLDATARPRMYRTGDGGRTWRRVTPDTTLAAYRLAVVSPTVAYAFAAGGATTLRTTDGGATWRGFVPRITP